MVARRVIGGIVGVGIILAVVVPVMLFVFGIGVDDVVPQSTDDPLLQVPVVNPPVIDPSDTTFTDGMTANDGSDVTSNTDIPPEDQEIIDEVDESINMTETSTDPPPAQVCDILNLFCGTANLIQLEANVVKIDSTLLRFNETFLIDVPLASLFVEETTNIDFRTGAIEVSYNLISEPNIDLISNGFMDILINDQSALITPVALKSSGMTNAEGKIPLEFVTMGGGTSTVFTFFFDQNFDKFPNEMISKLQYQIRELTITTDRIDPITQVLEVQTNGIIEQEVFSMDIFRDDIQIFITDAQGNEIRSYPQDDRFTVNSIARTQLSTYSCTDPTNPSAPTLSGRTGYGGTGCTFTAIAVANHPAPSVTNIKLFDANGIVINAGAGTGIVLDELLLRNQNYSVTSPYGDFGFMTPKSQKNYAYSCFLDQEVDYSRVTGSITNTIRPVAWDFYQPFVVGTPFIVCNFP